MDDEPKGFPITGVLLAHVVCCGGLVLVVTGTLSGLGTWLFDGGLMWLVIAVIVAATGLALWRRRRRKVYPMPLEPAEPETPSRHSKAA